MSSINKRAIISVAQKHPSYAWLARELIGNGWVVYATRGTLRYLASELSDLPKTFLRQRLYDMQRLTGFAETEDIKTLNPLVHAAVQTLHRTVRRGKKHMTRIDLVCVNLKPQDVGGLALIQSALKGRKVVVTLPEHCALALAAVHGDLRARAALWSEASVHLHRSLHADARALCPSPPFVRVGREVQLLRYGENPAQTPARRYALVGEGSGDGDPLSRERFNAVEGEDPSYTNETDEYRLVEALERVSVAYERNFGPHPARFIAIIGKHGNPCGAAVREADTPEEELAMQREALKAAVESDPISAFGGIVAVNFPIGEPEARILRETEWDVAQKPQGRPYDMVLAPAYTQEAIVVLGRKGGKAKLYQNAALGEISLAAFEKHAPERTLIRELRGTIITQPFPAEIPLLADPGYARVRGDMNHKRVDRNVRSLVLAWAIAAVTDSNAVSVVLREKLVGNGVGAVSRLIAAMHAADALRQRRDIMLISDVQEEIVAASDAFFPFSDGTNRLINAGVRTILAPEGSLNDERVSDDCRARDATLVFLPKHLRSFSGHG